MRASSSILTAALLHHAAEYRITMLDLGARGGVDQDLVGLAPAVVAIGFEPDPDEAERLQRSGKGPWLELRILPFAIGGKTGLTTLYIPGNGEGASLLSHNKALIAEFGHVVLHETIRQIPVSAITLDDLAAESQIDRIDYLKIDIEGAELDVLRAGTSLLSTCKVIKVECSFLEQRVGQPLAADVIAYLSANGFDLIDILDLHRWRRRPLPSHPYVIAFDMPYSRGRVAQADFVFARRADSDSGPWDISAEVIVLAAMGYIDHAITLVRQSPAAVAWWSARGIDIDRELREVSKRCGKQQVRRALWDQVRGLIPLVRSLFGTLPFRAPDRDY